MGQQTGKTCFWDNPNPPLQLVAFARFQAHPLSSFVGGSALSGLSGGRCSSRHAGENPFVIHPEKPAFISLINDPVAGNLLMPSGGWHRPIVPSGWPVNPGPTNRLAGGSGDSCVSCHRLPEMTGDFVGSGLGEYCVAVKEPATTRLANIFTGQLDETMPLRYTPPLPFPTFYGDRRARFAGHLNQLKLHCADPVSFGEVVSVQMPDNPTVLSAPYIDGPVYACSESVLVGGALPGATVELFRRDSLSNVNSEGVQVAVGPFDRLGFTLAQPVAIGDVFWATQVLGPQASGPGEEKGAIEYAEDFLPPPRIVVPIYECADSIGVYTQLRGVNAKIWKNSSAASFVPVPGDFTTRSPPKVPWQSSDSFHAETRLCNKTGPKVTVSASALPSTLKSGRFWTPPDSTGDEIYDGQEYLILEDLDNGAFARVSHLGTQIGDTTTDPEGRTFVLHLPTSGLGRSAQVGDQFSASASFFCGSVATGVLVTSNPVLPCSSLPPPRIAFPRDGDRSVTVTSYIPGARIRVYRSGVEIAEGAGPRVMLAPPNVLGANETIQVIQQLGSCIGTQVFQAITGNGQ